MFVTGSIELSHSRLEDCADANFRERPTASTFAVCWVSYALTSMYIILSLRFHIIFSLHSHLHRCRSSKNIKDRTLLNAVLKSPLVKATVCAYNRIEGDSMQACNARVRTLSQIILGIPFKAMKTLGLNPFDRYKFHDARSHARAYGPGQDPFEFERRRYNQS